MKQDCYFKQLW